MLALLMPDFGHAEIFQLIAGHLASLARHFEYGLVWGGSTLPILDAGIPLVLVDHDITQLPERSEFDLLGVDNTGGYLLGRHLIKLGCKRITFVARPCSASTVDARHTGLWNAVHRCGDASCSLSSERGNIADSVFANKIMASRPDTIACGNDHTAAVLIQTLGKLGISVPGDVRVVG